MSMWIVMHSSAQMPSSCMGTYRRVALVKLDQSYTTRQQRTKMISTRARGVLAVRDLGNFHVGKTERCAFAKAVARAKKMALELNTAAPIAEGDLLMSYGSA